MLGPSSNSKAIWPTRIILICVVVNLIKLRTDDYLWYKENLINIALDRLPDDCQYVAWIDGDIEFSNENLIYDTISKLETHNVVQMFEYANFLGPDSQVLRIDTGFGWSYSTGQPYYSRSYMPFKILRDDTSNQKNTTAGVPQTAANEKSLVDTEVRVKYPVITDDLYGSSPRPIPSTPTPRPDPTPPKSPCCTIVSKEPSGRMQLPFQSATNNEPCPKTQHCDTCPVNTKVRVKYPVITDNLYGSSPRPSPSAPTPRSDPTPPKSPCCIIVSNEPNVGENNINKQIKNFVYWHPGFHFLQF